MRLVYYTPHITTTRPVYVQKIVTD